MPLLVIALFDAGIRRNFVMKQLKENYRPSSMKPPSRWILLLVLLLGIFACNAPLQTATPAPFAPFLLPTPAHGTASPVPSQPPPVTPTIVYQPAFDNIPGIFGVDKPVFV